jgi:glutamate 5-kinase
VDDIATLAAGGADMLVVSSGAIALGRAMLHIGRRRLKLEESQACAAIGQIALAGAWSEELAQHGMRSGQVLVTLGDTEERRRYLNARATISTLLKMKAVPVINENDTVDAAERKEKAAALKKAAGRAPIVLSAATHEGLEEALRGLMEVIEEAQDLDMAKDAGK